MPSRSDTSAALDKAIERLGGDAPAVPSAATAAEREDNAGGSVPQPASSVVELDVGWFVWRGSPTIDPAARKGGVIVDAEDAESVVVVRDRLRGQGRQEAWFETWPIDDIDMTSAYKMPSSKLVQVAKRMLGSVYATINAGRWCEADEAMLMAVCRLTAPFSGGRAA